MARHIKEELLEALPDHTKLYIMYGATEASARLSYVEPVHLREKIESIGIPIPGVTMKIVDESGMELPDGETGELVASGANIMAGYWNDPQSTSAVLTAQGYHTGDLGYRDTDGYYHVVGRRDNQLKVGGHRINPQEVEDALVETGLVMECAVLGLEDSLAGHRLVAVVVPVSSETTEREVLYRSSQRLPRYKLPGEIKFVKILPKNNSGKSDRRACKELFLLLQ